MAPPARASAPPVARPLRVVDALLAAGLGSLQTLAYVHTTGGVWLLPLATVAWLAWRVTRATPWGAGVLGVLYGSAWVGAGAWWLFVSMHRYGGVAAPLAALAVALLALALSTYLGLAMASVARTARGRAVTDVPLFAGAWLLAELARGVWFTGFPWVASGYAQVDAPLAALAPWVGVYGVGAVGAALAAAAARGARGVMSGAVALVALAVAGAPSFTTSAGRLTVALLQTDVAQERKFDPEALPRTLVDLADDLRAAPDAALVVAPETAIPLLPEQLDELAPGYEDALRAHFARPGRAALVGVPLGDPVHGYTNSVVGWSDGAVYRYDKHHLVPFGEFVPTGFRWFTEAMQIPLGDFARGPVAQPSFTLGAQRAAPNVCYEDLFGEELARRFADADRAPTLLVNVSNIAWFGDTAALPQHLAISRLRSLELQRPMLRATNTGVTAVVDHRGHVVARLPAFQRGVLRAEVEGRTGRTPFARWAGAAGLWPLWLAGLALMLPAVASGWTDARRRGSGPRAAG
jgi:apolipoprotein N-acyltransferase